MANGLFNRETGRSAKPEGKRIDEFPGLGWMVVEYPNGGVVFEPMPGPLAWLRRLTDGRTGAELKRKARKGIVTSIGHNRFLWRS